MTVETTHAFGSGSSIVIDQCQTCGEQNLESVIFLGYLPPVNTMPVFGSRPEEQSAYPAHVVRCPQCSLIQLELIVDAAILFPPEYPYTSGTTKILRENFAELYRDCQSIVSLSADDLIVDIGSNDGTLLSNFAENHRVQGVTPEQVGKLAEERGIPTIISFFNESVACSIRDAQGAAKVITATNVFAHMENVHVVIEAMLELLGEDGVFISESHYLPALLETLQYDTIYHEHLRYYSLHSLKYLLEMHGLEVIHAKEIPTHGGSFRVYATRKGCHEIKPSVERLLQKELAQSMSDESLSEFRQGVLHSKLGLHALMKDIRQRGERVYGIGAPSRASTLINYVGLDDGILDCVLEIPGSHKIGKYMPGTRIPVEDEQRLFDDQPEYALLLSWHIADDLMPKLKQKGFTGDFIIPLPLPHIIRSEQIGLREAA